MQKGNWTGTTGDGRQGPTGKVWEWLMATKSDQSTDSSSSSSCSPTPTPLSTIVTNTHPSSTRIPVKVKHEGGATKTKKNEMIIKTKEEEVEIEILDIPDEFTPLGLRQALERCPLCFKRATPLQALKCVKSHRHYFCFFCFKVVSNDRLSIIYHFTLSHPDKFVSDRQMTVKCPFGSFPPPLQQHQQQTCVDRQFHYLSEFKNHVENDHLPFLDETIAFPSTSRRDKEVKVAQQGRGTQNRERRVTTTSHSQSSGYASAEAYPFPPLPPDEHVVQTGTNETVVDEMQQFLDLYQDVDDDESIASIPIHNDKDNAKEAAAAVDEDLTMTEEEYGHNVDVDNMAVDDDYKGPVNCATIVEETVQKNHAFECEFCHNAFRKKRGLEYHKVSEICTFLNDKFCANCDCCFEGFSVLCTILHLIDCRQN